MLPALALYGIRMAGALCLRRRAMCRSTLFGPFECCGETIAYRRSQLHIQGSSFECSAAADSEPRIIRLNRGTSFGAGRYSGSIGAV